MSRKFYITTTLPYVNAEPHIGFALEIVQADVLARYNRERGNEVFFNTGTDEHGAKIYEKAVEEGKNPQKYADEYAIKFDDLKKALNLSYDNFIRTTDEHHISSAQEFWRRCDKNGDIEKKIYKIKYCVGCELEKTDSELDENGCCPLHPKRDIEIREEENYFFKFSNYGDKLLKLYRDQSDFVSPDFRFNEIKRFVESGLEDFSISRLKEKMPWGIEVPGDDEHVMYVWFDALINYISAIGWPDDLEKFEKWWPVVQVAGKDQVRQQAAMWQAMLMSAGIAPSKQIFIHGFINLDGKKISKSAGNGVDPFYYVDKYGTDAVRYYLVRHIHPFEDSAFSEDRLKEAYNADLANGIGNFASRVSTLAEDIDFEGIEIDKEVKEELNNIREVVDKKMETLHFHEAIAKIWALIKFGDGYIDINKPWESKDKQVIFDLVVLLDNIASLALPIIPEASEKITKAISWKGDTLKIKKIKNLFPRIDA